MNIPTKKIRVAVLYGGRSGEHEISLQSAASVLRHLDRERFEAVPIGIDRQGNWLLNDITQIDTAHKSLPLQTANARTLASPSQAQRDQLFDVVFPALHGTFGEDGAVQGLLELSDIPYVGAGVLASAVGMDKDIAKRLAAAAGIAIAPYLAIKQGEWQNNSADHLKRIAQQFTWPVFVKPANAGSSVGIHKVKQAGELQAAIADALLYDSKVLVEQGIDAREIELAVLENAQYGAAPLVSVAGEIIPQLEFYSYAAKYLDENGAQLVIPAALSQQQGEKAQQLAGRIFALLECEGMARVDLFLDKHSGEFYFNEINTIPGFTSISMYPKLWQASGLPYGNLLTCLIELALARHQRKQQLKREWALA
jgi:D-alanine-D-alanine ligase